VNERRVVVVVVVVVVVLGASWFGWILFPLDVVLFYV
jgi:hypothetical protein